MRSVLLTLMIVFEATSSPAMAQTKKEDWPEGSSMRTLFELTESLDDSTQRLAGVTARLVQLVETSQMSQDLRLQRAVQAQGAAWIRYRQDECFLVGATDGGGAAWPMVHSPQCELQLTETRLETVRSVEACILAIPIDKRRYDGIGCLERLQVLKYVRPRH